MRSSHAASIILGCLAASAQIIALSVPAHDILTESSASLVVENGVHDLYRRSSGRAAAARAMKELKGGTFLSESQERQKIKSAKLKEEKEMITLAREEAKRKNAEQDRLRVERERVERERQLEEEQGKRNLRTEVEIAEEIAKEVKKKGDQVTKREKEKEVHKSKAEQVAATKSATLAQAERDLEAEIKMQQKKQKESELAGMQETITREKLHNYQSRMDVIRRRREAISVYNTFQTETEQHLVILEENAAQLFQQREVAYNAAMPKLSALVNPEIAKIVHQVLKEEYSDYEESEGKWTRVRSNPEVIDRKVGDVYIQATYKGVEVSQRLNNKINILTATECSNQLDKWNALYPGIKKETQVVEDNYEAAKGRAVNFLDRMTVAGNIHRKEVDKSHDLSLSLSVELDELDEREWKLELMKRKLKLSK